MNSGRFLQSKSIIKTIESLNQLLNELIIKQIDGRAIPMHFSKCGAKRDDATGRSQFGHVQSTAFFVFVEPNTSISGISTILNLNQMVK